ncbi:MAG: extracellular solute-binding protein [Lachnospiraceae bacterium]|nr:extracellular solute-binding protein [Lachnospiraceae bacterium]
MKKIGTTKKVVAAMTMAAMTVSGLAGCGASGDTAATTEPAAEETTEPAAEETTEAAAETTEAAEETTETAEAEEDVEGYTVLTDADGNAYDLGGMEIIIRDWWSDAEGAPREATNAFQEAQDEWREWCYETYNFTVKEQGMSGWDTTPEDYANYVTGGGDDANYVWRLRDDAMGSALASGLMYDLSTLDCLDFDSDMFTRNKCNVQYTIGDGTYAMYAGYSEPRLGIFFNKRLLEDAGIDPDSLYDMVADGTWTWDKFEEMLGQVQRDTDNDGEIDVWGLAANGAGNILPVAVAGNGGAFVGKDDSGNFTYNLEDQATLDAMEYTNRILQDYYFVHHTDEDAWDHYKEEFQNGTCVFLAEDTYCGYQGGIVEVMDDECGYVPFPKSANGDYINVWANNPEVIPACYDEEKAWNIAFAYSLYNQMPPGYEDYNNYLSNWENGAFDSRCINEVLPMLQTPEHGTVQYHGTVPQLQIGPDLTWNFSSTSVVSELVDGIRDTWKGYIDDANAAFNK